MRRLALSSAAVWLTIAIGSGVAAPQAPAAGGVKLTSPAFADHGAIPSKYTCDGENVSPPLEWSGVPADARSLVLIVEDPDAPDPAAPRIVWVHWVLYDLPASSNGLPDAPTIAQMPAGTRAGVGNAGN
ncbi:MAG: YbhB/YbcL family Raf kinase inhibitor-like protein, partial [Candidatus Binataceae bacterium]